MRFMLASIVFMLLFYPAAAPGKSNQRATDFTYKHLIRDAHNYPYLLDIFNRHFILKETETTLRSGVPLPSNVRTLTVKEQAERYIDAERSFSCNIIYVFKNMKENISKTSIDYTFDVLEECKCKLED